MVQSDSAAQTVAIGTGLRTPPHRAGLCNDANASLK